MCDICGCDEGASATATNLQTGRATVVDANGGIHAHEHVHADGARHSHAGAGAHEHTHLDGTRHAHAVPLEARILARNDALAARNRDWLSERGIVALNMMGAPGAGKTTLLERTVAEMKNRAVLSIIEGDQATTLDSERIRSAGAAVVQLNTGTGCHLEANMVARALAELQPARGSIVIVENVGNLVCPALFDLGESRRVVIFSVTEGADKPLKYPHMFRAADLVLLNKTDLLPYVDFDPDRAAAAIRAVNPDCAVLQVSARTGDGMEAWYSWMLEKAPKRLVLLS
jgi:hydrogenase nickel incorporation protein HypB